MSSSRRPPRHPSILTTGPVPASSIEAFHELASKSINFEPMTWEDACEDPDWRTDQVTRTLVGDGPGPTSDGAFSRACQALVSYEFADPDIVRAVYDADAPLEGRNMVLVGRFLHLRFNMGVRIGGVFDTTTRVDGQRIQRFGWHYRTLQGHLEQGQMDYELRKYIESGRVEFRVWGYSRASHIDNPIVRVGFALFGRREQLRFYRNILDRMERIANEPAVHEGS